MRIEIPEKKKFVYEMVFPVRWGDMDVMGHVNNTVYLRWMETIRIEWCRTVNAAPNPQGQGIVIANVFCNFYRQFEYPDDVRVRMFVSDPGRSSFETWVTMAPVREPDAVYAAGGATTVWVDFPAQKSAPLPEALRAHLV